MPEPCLEADAVSRRHPNGRGVFDVSLALRPGQVLGVTGPNGCGKSTLAGVLATLHPPTAGAVRWFGCTDRRSPRVRGQLGVVPDRPVHFDHLTGGQNAAFFAAQYGVPRATAGERLDALFAWAGLAAARDLPVGDYSLGMRRRLSLVEALVHDPRLLVLDEPSLGLDDGGHTRLAEELVRRAQTGAAVLLATNDLALARAVCDDVLRLEHGRLEAAA